MLYRFEYLQGAQEAQETANFKPILAFPDLNESYGSPRLFPLFQNRLLRPNRPDYPDFIKWLNLPKEENDPIALLSRSGGRRQTDTFEVFPCPEPDENGDYHIHFFTHGLSHFPAAAQKHIQNLQPSDRLMMMHDIQNAFDSRALILRTVDQNVVGFCPRYLTKDFFELVSNFPQQVQITVERVNPSPTPLQFRLLCNLTAQWGQSFQPFSGPTYQSLASTQSLAIV